MRAWSSQEPGQARQRAHDLEHSTVPLRTETVVSALGVFTLFWARHAPLEDRDTCGHLSGFYLVLGTTWASGSRDTCEHLSGFYLVLGATWASWSRDTCESLSGFYLVLGTT